MTFDEDDEAWAELHRQRELWKMLTIGVTVFVCFMAIARACDVPWMLAPLCSMAPTSLLVGLGFSPTCRESLLLTIVSSFLIGTISILLDFQVVEWIG